jgi:hypothetical protein
MKYRYTRKELLTKLGFDFINKGIYEYPDKVEAMDLIDLLAKLSPEEESQRIMMEQLECPACQNPLLKYIHTCKNHIKLNQELRKQDKPVDKCIQVKPVEDKKSVQDKQLEEIPMFSGTMESLSNLVKSTPTPTTKHLDKLVVPEKIDKKWFSSHTALSTENLLYKKQCEIIDYLISLQKEK